MITFKFEEMSEEDVKKYMKKCGKKHGHQHVYSRLIPQFQDFDLTQICFGCKKIRSTNHFIAYD